MNIQFSLACIEIKITKRTTGARGCYFQTSVNQVYKASLNLDKISRNMLHVMRIVQKVSHIMIYDLFVYKYKEPSIQ